MNEFLDAWNDWDNQPSNRDKVIVFQQECKRYADLLDLPVLEFQKLIMEFRREGKSKFEIVTLLEKSLE